MPTLRRRVQVTIDDELRAAVETARKAWPELPDSQLIAALARRGADALVAGQADRKASREAAIDHYAGEFDECFPEGYLAQLREEWPA